MPKHPNKRGPLQPDKVIKGLRSSSLENSKKEVRHVHCVFSAKDLLPGDYDTVFIVL